ncbi:hypothetical protein OXPF_11960 [Oxobacter pfennigii]|uniref:DUF2935 domain-containing protein n=1 Tax=Oxobacter pfennigii TaxID=36849 RepID=A0A0P8YZK3_9CLOT|nr:hypothetical protein OXPF_11960 [Oxobacter pfennigii]
MTDYEKAALFEHRFWLQILGDHSRFIFNSLYPDEKKEMQKAGMFIEIFDGLLDEARGNLLEKDLLRLTRKACQYTMELKQFKLQILESHITGKIKISLPPTFFNHMLNELEEYQGILYVLIYNRMPKAHAVHHHLLWLLDGSGHASWIGNNLDDTERELIKISRNYAKDLEGLYLKAVEMKGYLRTGKSKFPSLEKFNEDAEMKMLDFKVFLNEIEKLILEKKVLSTILPLVPDHMAREECYYLTKLAMAAGINAPGCEPGKPRVED